MRPRHVVLHPGKPTFIQIHNKPACDLVLFNPLLETLPPVFVGFWVSECFFYMSHQDA